VTHGGVIQGGVIQGGVIQGSAGSDVAMLVGTLVGIEVGKDVGTLVGMEVGTLVGIEVGVDVGTLVGMEVGMLVGRLVGSDVGVGVGLADLWVVGVLVVRVGVDRALGVLAAVCAPPVPVVPGVLGATVFLLFTPTGAVEPGDGSVGGSAKPWGEMMGFPVATRTAIWRSMASSGRSTVTPTMAMVTQRAPPTAATTMPGLRLLWFSSASSRSGTCWGTWTICSPSASGRMSSCISASGVTP
jgi:hypothetical protein